MDSNLKAQIRHLCSYITDRSAVLNYVNRENDLRLTLKDIEDVMAKAPRERRANLKPLRSCPPIRTHKGRGYDPLARALFQYHADRTTGAEHDFWLSRLLLPKGRRRSKVSI
jgi:hypothetical protein